jgi:hypothetical protein
LFRCFTLKEMFFNSADFANDTTNSCMVLN